jgi:transposase
MRPIGSPEVLERRRRHAIALLKDGLAPFDVAMKLKVDRRSVRRWKAAFFAHGLDSLQAKPTPGRPPRLNTRQKAKLEEQLLRGAKAAGFPTDLWTCPRIAQWIDSHLGIHYHIDHIGRFLRSLGWSPQKPQRKAIERNEAEVQRWIKKEWPQIKKKPPA